MLILFKAFLCYLISGIISIYIFIYIHKLILGQFPNYSLFSCIKFSCFWFSYGYIYKLCEFKLNKPHLYILTYPDYIPQKLYTQFTKKTGVQIIECKINTDGNAELSLLLTNSQIDLVLLSSYSAQNIQKLNKLYNIQFANQITPKRFFVPFISGYYRIAYNEKVTSILGGEPFPLDLIFDLVTIKKLSEAGLKIAISDCCFDIFHLLAIYKGYDINHLSDQQICNIWNHLFQIRPYLTKIKALAIANDVKCDLIDVALDISILLTDNSNPNFKYCNLDHYLHWSDGFCIPNSSKNYQLANEFLNFLISPEGQEIIEKYVAYNNMYRVQSINEENFMQNSNLEYTIQLQRNWRYFKMSHKFHIFDDDPQSVPQILFEYWDTLQITRMVATYCWDITHRIYFV